MPTLNDPHQSAFSKNLVALLLFAGMIGQIMFETYAWILSPPMFGVSLEPANLVIAVLAKTANIGSSYATAFLLHLVIGTLGFPLVVLLLKKLTGFRFVWAGALAGAILWFVAQGILAPYIGRSFMMSFGAYTQSSFIGHVGMNVIIGFVLEITFARQKQAALASH